MDVLQMMGCACRPMEDDRYSIARSRLGIEVPSLIPLSVTSTWRTHLIKHFLDLFPLWSESTRLQPQGQLLALRSSLEWVAFGVRWESHWWLPVAIKSSSLGDGRIRTRRYVNICVFSHFSLIELGCQVIKELSSLPSSTRSQCSCRQVSWFRKCSSSLSHWLLWLESPHRRSRSQPRVGIIRSLQ